MERFFFPKEFIIIFLKFSCVDRRYKKPKNITFNINNLEILKKKKIESLLYNAKAKSN